MKNRTREICTSGSVRDEAGQPPHLLGHRRKFLHLAAGAAALPILPRIARAQAYPTRPVRIISGFAAGGSSDTHARLTGQWLSERLGQPFIIENRPGANSNIATEAVVRSRPDGYTLLMISPTQAINATLYDKLNFNFIRDIVPVASVASEPFVMVVNSSFPARTVPEFIDYAKANPGRLNMASSGIGNISHVAGELLKIMTGIKMMHVPYRGGAPAITDLLGGQVQVYINAMSTSLEYVRAGKLRALAVTTTTRLEALPDVPTLGEFVPGYEVSFWNGLGAPSGTPAEIVEKLNTEVRAAVTDPAAKARFTELGSMPVPMTPEEFREFVAGQTKKWATVIRAANIKL